MGRDRHRVAATIAGAVLFLARPLSAAEPITSIADVRSLPREEAARALPARVRGVVTWQGGRDYVTVQDDTGGIWANFGEARQRRIWTGDETTLAQLHVGREVEIEGVSDPGGYAPVILPRALRLLGEKPLPPPRPMIPARFFNGAEAGQRIEARGVVLGVQPLGSDWTLRVDANSGVFSAEISRAALAEPEKLVDAEVRLRGVAASSFNTRGELTSVRILISITDDVVIEKLAPASPFAAPLVPLDRLQPFRPDPTLPHRVRIEGTVTFALPGQFIFLQHNDCAVRVETHSTLALRAGDRAEAVGFVDLTRHIGMLREAEVRKIGEGTVPAAVAISPEEILALNTAALDTGQTARPHDFDGHLIRFRARLLAVQSAPDGRPTWRRLTLEQGSSILGAILHEGDPAPLDALRPGSEVEVTGLVQLEYAPWVGKRQLFRPARLDVFLRDATDAVVLRAPTWWTTPRLQGAMAVGLLALGGAMLWAWQLRRQVQRKTQQLAAEMHARRDAAIEFQATLRERNRLAANLHDTLLQTLSGLNYQLEACEAESLPLAERKANHLETARRMVARGQEDLRGTVWALRVLPLKGRTFTDAMRTLAQQVGEGHGVKISVSGETIHPPMSEFVAGNLLLVAQEAMHNAAQHARPASVRVDIAVDPDGEWVRLTVRDDGVGFTLDPAAGPKAGHFGLPGMRERVERLGGSLRIETAPGQGTTVHVEVPLRPFDEEIA
jgi:signal transduction histidine kinase